MSVVGASPPHDLVICGVPEIGDGLVEKPVATLLAETQAFEIARSRRLSSQPGLYKCVTVRLCVCVCVCAPLPPICEGIESHKAEAFAHVSF